MTDSRAALIAYLATLSTLVIIFIAALIASGSGVTVGEAFGMGTITGGLIGVLRMPSRPATPADNGAVIAAIDKIPPVTTADDSLPDAVAAR